MSGKGSIVYWLAIDMSRFFCVVALAMGGLLWALPHPCSNFKAVHLVGSVTCPFREA